MCFSSPLCFLLLRIFTSCFYPLSVKDSLCFLLKAVCLALLKHKETVGLSFWTKHSRSCYNSSPLHKVGYSFDSVCFRVVFPLAYEARNCKGNLIYLYCICNLDCWECFGVHMFGCQWNHWLWVRSHRTLFSKVSLRMRSHKWWKNISECSEKQWNGILYLVSKWPEGTEGTCLLSLLYQSDKAF